MEGSILDTCHYLQALRIAQNNEMITKLNSKYVSISEDLKMGVLPWIVG